MAVHLPGKLLSSAKVAPVVWSSVRHMAPDGEHTLVGVFPPASEAHEARPTFANTGRVEVANYQLTPRLIAREELTVEFTLAAVSEKNFAAGVMGMVSGLIANPAVAFVSQIIPAMGAMNAAGKVMKMLGGLVHEDKLQAIGAFAGTLRAPTPSGLVAFTETNEDKPLTFDPATNQLMTSDGPVKTAYAVLRLQCEAKRPDWMTLPDLRQAWGRIREAALAGGDVLGAIEYFRITAVTSPDLTREDAQRIVDGVRQKFAPVLAGEESASFEDPGDFGDALAFFLDGPAGGEAVTPLERNLAALLEKEPGYIARPSDPPHATNKGITQATYDDFRKRQNIPKRSIREMRGGELKDIYLHGYWRAAMCHEMPSEALSVLMFDAAVNLGPPVAIRLLQQAAGVPDALCDGKWSPQTRAAVLAASANPAALVDACLLRRERYCRRIVALNPKLGAFLRPWMNRIVTLRARLLPLLAGAPSLGFSELALIEDDGARLPLAAAPAELSAWAPPAEPIDAAPLKVAVEHAS